MKSLMSPQKKSLYIRFETKIDKNRIYVKVDTTPKKYLQVCFKTKCGEPWHSLTKILLPNVALLLL